MAIATGKEHFGANEVPIEPQPMSRIAADGIMHVRTINVQNFENPVFDDGINCDRFFSQKELNIPEDLREIWDSIVDISVRCELVKKKTVIFGVGNPNKGIDSWGDHERCPKEFTDKARWPEPKTVTGMEVRACR